MISASAWRVRDWHVVDEPRLGLDAGGRAGASHDDDAAGRGVWKPVAADARALDHPELSVRDRRARRVAVPDETCTGLTGFRAFVISRLVERHTSPTGFGLLND